MIPTHRLGYTQLQYIDAVARYLKLTVARDFVRVENQAVSNEGVYSPALLKHLLGQPDSHIDGTSTPRGGMGKVPTRHGVCAVQDQASDYDVYSANVAVKGSHVYNAKVRGFNIF